MSLPSQQGGEPPTPPPQQQQLHLAEPGVVASVARGLARADPRLASPNPYGLSPNPAPSPDPNLNPTLTLTLTLISGDARDAREAYAKGRDASASVAPPTGVQGGEEGGEGAGDDEEEYVSEDEQCLDSRLEAWALSLALTLAPPSH